MTVGFQIQRMHLFLIRPALSAAFATVYRSHLLTALGFCDQSFYNINLIRQLPCLQLTNGFPLLSVPADKGFPEGTSPP